MQQSSDEKTELLEHYKSVLRSCFGGQDWIVAMDVLVATVGLANRLKDLGANRVLAIGGLRGTGEIKPKADVETINLGVSDDGMMDTIHRVEDTISNLPTPVYDQVNAWDPDHGAKAIRTIFAPGLPVAGREVFGGRPPAWTTLEDKTIAHSLFTGAGIPHAPSRVVPVEACARAAQGLDRGMGTVWAGDNREGWHGGASRTRWVRNPEEGKRVQQFLSQYSDTARVMPFLDGIPCSIHGIVFPKCTIALRPCEMLVFRTPADRGFVYSSAATLWDPPDADRKAMRSAAKQMGEHLRQRAGFLGAFTLDGVMTSAGFLPTEVNTRYGAGLARISRSLPDLNLRLLCCAISDGLNLDWRPEELEALVTDAADETRIVGGNFHARNTKPPTDAGKRPIQKSPHGYEFAPEDTEDPDGTIEIGPAGTGTIVLTRLNASRLPTGASAAPYVRDALALANQTWNLGMPELEPAPDIRP